MVALGAVAANDKVQVAVTVTGSAATLDARESAFAASRLRWD